MSIKTDKCLLYIITIILDLSLLYILYNKINNFYDKMFIIVTLLCHLLFIYALYIEDAVILDILHLFVFILPLFSIFIKSKNIKILVLLLLILIQILWKYMGRCILNTFSAKKNNFGYGYCIEIATFILTIILSYQIIIL